MIKSYIITLTKEKKCYISIHGIMAPPLTVGFIDVKEH